MELIDVKNKTVIDAIHKLNDRPRKYLKFKTPDEVFEELAGINVKQLWGHALMA
jgi:IS30 family transposase